MGSISAFLQPPVTDETKEVIISQRFKGADGEPVPFVLRVINQAVNSRLIKQCTTNKKQNGMVYQQLDSDRYGKLLIQACVAEPNFKDTELCSYYGTLDPLEVPEKMLTVGEYNKLVTAIKELNGLLETDEELEELKEEAKNS